MKVFAVIAPFVGAADWEWVDIEGSKCVGGQQTGVWTRQGTGPNLGVYLYGGGACFNTLTCDTMTTDPKPGNPGTAGIFDSRSDNPLVEYNWMAVPYCTGDVHAGDDAKTFKGSFRNFNGSPNLKLMMAYATKTFTAVETIFITGESAGGFGSLASYATIRDFYPDARGVMMDDSGPILDDDSLAPCLQAEWRQDWNLNKNIPSDCQCDGDSGNLVSIWSYLKQRYPKDSMSLVSSQSDSTISMFFAFGNNDCHALLPVGYSKLQAGLEALSTTVPVYQIPGSVHTHTSSDEFYTRTVAGATLFQWIGQLIDANQADPSSVEPTAEDLVAEMTNSRATPARVIV